MCELHSTWEKAWAVEAILEWKNWVTVRDKCPQINVKLKWHTGTFFFFFERTDKRTDNGTDKQRKDGRTDSLIL